MTLNGSSGARERSTDGLVNQSVGTLWANDIGLSIRQLIFDGGLIANEARATTAFYESQRFLQMSTIESRVVELAEVYLDYLRVTEQLAAARKNISNHKEMRCKLIELERNGGVRADTSLVDGRLSLAENNLYAQEFAMENARWRFVRLTGAEPKTLTTPTHLLNQLAKANNSPRRPAIPTIVSPQPTSRPGRKKASKSAPGRSRLRNVFRRS